MTSAEPVFGEIGQSVAFEQAGVEQAQTADRLTQNQGKQ
jgi:hypothetical protein